MQGTRSSATITIVGGHHTAAAIGTATINVKGRDFKGGQEWDFGYTSTATAVNIAAAITGDEYTASASSNIITIVARATGTAANSWTITSSTPAALALSNSVFGNGQGYGYISINGTTLTEGTDFVALVSSHATANSLAVAINANATLSALISVSSATGAISPLTAGYLQLISKLSGVNAYPVSISSPALVAMYPMFNGGINTDISVADNTFAETAHGLSNGLQVVLQKSAGTIPTGLTAGTTYFVIRNTANSFSVSTSSSGVNVGAAVDVTAVTGGGTFTFAPLAYSAGPNAFYWRGSNDGSKFYTITATSVSISGSGGDLWSFPAYGYKYLMFNYTPPTSGGMDLNIIINKNK